MMHNIKVFGGLAVVFFVGAYSAFHGGFTPTNIIDMLVSGLIAVEHSLNGNTTPSAS